MWSNDRHFPPRRGFLTPQPPAWNKTHTAVLPLSERKRTSPAPADKSNCFHVMHKVPASDSPYGRAKHVQLIDKDPSKAISLFWAAINAGDRVDSALKDMAVVMKQLDRSDEAIEAIKSFRHLCPCESQESLDNVLVELYKRSGRVEEEIEMLQNRLRNIEEGTIFGGKRTKIARSQGKKIQITIDQEKARILGNLAWAYLQQHNYGIAEQHYRKALALEPDMNKQCNLAICLMHMKRISEAKSLLQDLKASSGNEEEMDKSYSKSYERALDMLVQVESQPGLNPVSQEQPDKGRESRRSLISYKDKSLKEAGIFLPINEDNISGVMDRILPHVHWDGKMISEQNDNCFGYDDRNSSNCTPIGSSSQTMCTEKWRNWKHSRGEELGSAHQRIYACSAASRKNSEVLYTQPRQCSWEFSNSDQKRGERWREDTVRNSIRKLSFEQVEEDEEVHKGLSEVLFTQPSVLKSLSPRTLYEDPLVSRKDESNIKVGKMAANPVNRKSWADMVEEEELQLSESKCVNKEKEFNDENINSNIINPHPDTKDHHIGNITQRFASLDVNMKAGDCNAPPPNIVSRRNRLQVFREITSP